MSPSTVFGPVQPFGLRSTIIGQSGRSDRFPPRAACWIARIFGERRVQRRSHLLMHDVRLVALDEDRRIAVAFEQLGEFVRADPRQYRRIGDLVAVEMQDRQHRAVRRGIEEFVAMPGGRQRSGFGFAVADDAGDDEIGIVEHRPISMRQRIAEFAAFVDRSRRLRGGMARNAAGKGELPEQAAHARLILRNIGIELAIGALEPGVGDDARRAMTRARDEQDVQCPAL